MKIGIDLDGVVIDSIKTFRAYEEIYDINILKGNHLKSQCCLEWIGHQD